MDLTIHGYLAVRLCKKGVKYATTVHRLVLETFVGLCPDSMEACHNNGIRDDNRLGNLRWDTRKNNQRDRIKHGTDSKGKNNPMYGKTHTEEARKKISQAQKGHQNSKGEFNSMAKLNYKQVRVIRWLCNNSDIFQYEIANIFNVSPTTIGLIKKNKLWG